MKLFFRMASLALAGFLSTSAFADGVLVLGAPSDVTWLDDVRAKIAGTGLISGPVDAMYLRDTSPTPEQVAAYDAVLVFSDYPFFNPDALGNLLADFVDQGKGVVQMTFAYANNGLGVGGRFRAEGMDIWAPGGQDEPGNLTMATPLVPDHEILRGVRSLSGGVNYHNTVGALRAGAVDIVKWSNDRPLVGVDTTTRAGRIVGLNFYPPSSTVRNDFWDAATDGALLMANALNFAASSLHYRHSCVAKDQKLRCWGANSKGQLGLGHKNSIGDDPNEVGQGLPVVDLGDFPVDRFALGGETSCVISRGRLKCFGRNDSGQLGLGDLINRGEAPDQMGGMLPEVNLGTGVLAKDVATSGGHTCVVTTTDQMKCFGSNKGGQLGYGDVRPRGGSPDDMGDNLPFVDLGAGAKVKQVALGERHTCVLLADNKVKCFGQGTGGRLGTGAGADVGATSGQMGDALTAVDFGTNDHIKKLTSGKDFNCVQFDSGDVKCFGANSFGQLGLGDNHVRGDSPATMGANLPPLDFGSNQYATTLACGPSTCCVTLVQGTMKCWGVNFSGQLGLGDKLSRGAHPQDMGDDLPQITLDRLSKIQEVTVKEDFLCATDEHGTKCWGSNRDGALGYGDMVDRGGTPNQVPRLIPYLPL